MTLTLYVIPLSHPAVSARLMLEHKRIDHRVVSLLSGLHPLLLRAMGFRAGTVPALRADGRRIQGSLQIARFLEQHTPDPPLYPSSADARRAVEEAERWGAEVLQPVPRRLYRWALVRRPELRRDLAQRNHLPLSAVAGVLMKPLAFWFARFRSGADEAAVRRDLEQLPRLLDHADGLIAAGVIGADRRNAATLQIAPSVRVLLNFAQFQDLLRNRPIADLARAICPEYPGAAPDVFPHAWLPGAESRTDAGETG